MLGAVPAQYLNLGCIQNRVAPRLRKQELAASGGSRRWAVRAGADYVILHFGSPPCRLNPRFACPAPTGIPREQGRLGCAASSSGATYTSQVGPVAWTVIEFLSSCDDVGRLATRLWAAAAALHPLTAGIGNLALRRSGVRRR